ncbi:MAG TPA: hypothetical protein VHL77_04415 [Ferruginibacter sp.]|jgi:hypothetical protein|nr:hypothetical protein [Ferruginibacter sp.]
MKYVSTILICSLLFSCNDPFINHKLKYEKAADDCSGMPGALNFVSNLNGERYEFYSCLDNSFDGKQYTVSRMGDSIIVDFPRSANNKTASYKLTLDIDAKPAYHHIIIDGRELHVVPMQR